MDDLARLFRNLVEVMTTDHPERLNSAFQLSELYQSILPYRKYKKQLGFECNEDYEMAVLRLFAGESDYATVEPAEVQEQLVLEAQAANPNPGAFREFAAARVKLNETAVRSIQAASRSFAPPTPPAAQGTVEDQQWAPPTDVAAFAPPASEPTAANQKPPVFEAIEHTMEEAPPVPEPYPVDARAPQSRCPNCDDELPKNRSILFCPFCGYRVGPTACPNCGEEIEAGWRFCVTCGRGDSNA